MPIITPKLSPVLLTNWLQTEFSHDLLLGFDNLPGWLTKLRKTLCLDLQFIIKDAIHKQPDRRDAQGNLLGWGVEWGFHALSRHTTFLAPQCVHGSGSSPNSVVQEFGDPCSTDTSKNDCKSVEH